MNQSGVCQVISGDFHLCDFLICSELDNVVEDSLSSVMFDATVVAECLNQQGMNVDRLSDPYHYKSKIIIHSLIL